MTPVDQTIVCAEKGDCMRAVVASLFNLELDQVPHFRLFDTEENQGSYFRNWYKVMTGFFYSMGYEVEYYLRSDKKKELEESHSIEGYFYAAVASKTFNNVRHAVVMDINGVVVHDPNPNKAWQDVNVLESGEVDGWYCCKKRNL